jgi:hypothetical protein
MNGKMNKTTELIDTTSNTMATKAHNMSARVSERKIGELTEAAECGHYGVLTKFLNSVASAAERVDILQRIEWTNRENRFKTGKLPRLSFVTDTFSDSDFVDVALLKKASDWLFQDDVLYRESIIMNLEKAPLTAIIHAA